MAEVSFEPRYRLRATKNPELDVLRDIFLHAAGAGHEFGDALLRYSQVGAEATLIVLSDSKLGYYLKYIDTARQEWLSLGDRTRLSEVVCPEDWEASAGLFLSPPVAWEAIQEFCASGERCAAVTWIRPEEMPADGNW